MHLLEYLDKKTRKKIECTIEKLKNKIKKLQDSCGQGCLRFHMTETGEATTGEPVILWEDIDNINVDFFTYTIINLENELLTILVEFLDSEGNVIDSEEIEIGSKENTSGEIVISVSGVHSIRVSSDIETSYTDGFWFSASFYENCN